MGSNIKFEIDGFAGQGYLALPKNPGPAVIVIQEWWGLVDHIKSIVDRLAAEGFVAFAPDLYHGQASTEPDIAKKLMMELKLEEAAHEIQGSAKYLLSLNECNSEKVSVMGFCMGGTLAIWGASKVAEISKAIAFYPGSSWERHKPTWSNFDGKEAMIHCAEGDGTSTAPGIQEAVNEINSAGGVIKTFDYPGSAHAFFNDDRPAVYLKDAAELAWSRSVEFLRSIPQK